MRLDLAAAANRNATQRGSARAVWSGGRIEIDEEKLAELIARATAFVMGENLFAGRRPDGRGAMPGRQRDGRPRGMGALVARALAPLKVGPLTYVIAAHRERAGHLARILQEVPLRAPPLETMRAAVHAAFLASVKVSTERGR